MLLSRKIHKIIQKSKQFLAKQRISPDELPQFLNIFVAKVGNAGDAFNLLELDEYYPKFSYL